MIKEQTILHMFRLARKFYFRMKNIDDFSSLNRYFIKGYLYFERKTLQKLNSKNRIIRIIPFMNINVHLFVNLKDSLSSHYFKLIFQLLLE
jgi:hypothetical protein